MPPTTDPQPRDAARPDVLVRQMIMGFRLTQMIYAAAKFGIADALAEEARSADDLAAACGAHPQCSLSPTTRSRQRWPF
jgi:hypothetical protein